MRARVLYTKHLTKKRKTWSDGYVEISPQRLATLSDEDGRTLGTARLSPSENWSEDTEDINSFEGYLVNIDELEASAAHRGRRPGNPTHAPQSAAATQ
ncbi:hypothetical protein WJX73_010750 [Symbiochloris irregularis]|uniref:5'-3' DNA helicase ZGRF1-like N-terminal domain-containing protein n=1 Tax=Symbiochloris irregularis TaxID=706552 RepID=A0AAW1NZ94_9CHLO